MKFNSPTHIAIMMDGNGRWGRQRGLTRSQGHFAGSKAMEGIIDGALEFGIKVLTLYAFSTENWTRPKEEVNYLMDLPAQYLVKKLPEFMRKNIKILISGDVAGLPEHTQRAVETAVNQTKSNNKLIVNFALNYGGRHEILSAVKSILNDMNDATIAIDNINEELLENYLHTTGLPDPDIIIRTGGEKRFSNFLLWQSSTSEIWFTKKYFPDFTKEMLMQAIKEVDHRKSVNQM